MEEEAERQEVGFGKVVASMRHLADLHLALGPLSTGYSKDIHGKVGFSFSALPSRTDSGKDLYCATLGHLAWKPVCQAVA